MDNFQELEIHRMIINIKLMYVFKTKYESNLYEAYAF